MLNLILPFLQIVLLSLLLKETKTIVRILHVLNQFNNTKAVYVSSNPCSSFHNESESRFISAFAVMLVRWHSV